MAGYKLTQDEKDQVGEMLMAIIGHWSILKNTSIEGLRNSFLQREGRLENRDDQWRLTVQQMGHDMLLDHVPWNFRMIKLPWMNQLLMVEWF